MSRKLKLTDILVTIVIAIVFGIIYKFWGPVYDFVKPLGLHIDQLVYGMWFIAAPVAFLVLRKPGVALLAEVAAASGEFLVGSEWGLQTLVAGVVQGLFAELIFMAFRYKRFNMGITILAAIASAIGSIIMDFSYGYIDDLALWNLALYLIARIIGSILIAGVFAFYLVRALEATGVTNVVRPIDPKDFDELYQ